MSTRHLWLATHWSAAKVTDICWPLWPLNPDLNEWVEGLLLVVFWDDLREQNVLALGQLDEGTDAVDVGVDLDVQHVVLPWWTHGEGQLWEHGPQGGSPLKCFAHKASLIYIQLGWWGWPDNNVHYNIGFDLTHIWCAFNHGHYNIGFNLTHIWCAFNHGHCHRRYTYWQSKSEGIFLASLAYWRTKRTLIMFRSI